jgi:hypothetical protein
MCASRSAARGSLRGSFAPFGLATAERRHPPFQIHTRVTTANGMGLSRPRFPDLHEQRLKLEDGRTVPSIDEDLNPLTAEWLARTMKIRKRHVTGAETITTIPVTWICLRDCRTAAPCGQYRGNEPASEREVWDWSALDRVPYHGRTLSLWHRGGTKFGER